MGKWLREVFSEEITVRRADIKGDFSWPKGDYDLWLVEGLIASFVLITPRPGVGNPTVLGIAELVHAVREHSVRFVAYGTGSLSAVERRCLLARQVPFVVAGRQVFLPFLGIAQRADPVALSRTFLGRTAQRFMLAYLDGHTGVFDNQFVYRKMNCAPAAVRDVLRAFVAASDDDYRLRCAPERYLARKRPTQGNVAGSHCVFAQRHFLSARGFFCGLAVRSFCLIFRSKDGNILSL